MKALLFVFVAAIVSLPLIVNSVGQPEGKMEGVLVDEKMSFLIVRVDELRASSVGCYGDPYAMTSRIDALAADGVLFSRAISNEPVCSANRTSFDTGFFTHANRNGNKLHPSDETIQNVLDDEGYRTFHIGKWHKTPSYLQVVGLGEMVPSGILDGFDHHSGHERGHNVSNSNAVYYKNGVALSFSALPWRPQKYVDLAIAQIDVAVAAGVPFYGVVDIELPHYPYGPIVGTEWDVFSAGEIPAPPNVPVANVTDAEIDLARYYSMVFCVDDMLGQLLDHLTISGLDDSTIVIFTSDHGGHLGAHGLIEDQDQKRTPYAEAINIPMIIRDPYGESGTTSSVLLSTVDLKPWILERANAPVDPLGHSTAHLSNGRLLMIHESAANSIEGRWYGFLRVDGMKYVRSENSGPWLLFNTADDPFELNNLIGTGDPREAEMDALLDAAAVAVGLVIPF